MLPTDLSSRKLVPVFIVLQCLQYIVRWAGHYLPEKSKDILEPVRISGGTVRIFYCQIIRKWYQIRSAVGAETLINIVIFKIFVLSKSLSGKKRGS